MSRYRDVELSSFGCRDVEMSRCRDVEMSSIIEMGGRGGPDVPFILSKIVAGG